MREVLVRFSNEGDISKLCVCKADELSIRRGVRGSSEFIGIGAHDMALRDRVYT